MDYLDVNRKAYDETAGEYSERVKIYAESDKEILEPFISLMKEKFDTPKVLELGPGSGLALKFFVDAGFETKAIDFSSKIIEVARKTTPSTEFVEADFLEHEFNEKFDGVFAKAFIHLFPKEDALRVFDKVRELLNPSGLFYLSTTVHDVSDEGFFEKRDYEKRSLRFRRRWTEEELLEVLKDKGFEIVKKFYSEEKNFGKRWITLISRRV